MTAPNADALLATLATPAPDLLCFQWLRVFRTTTILGTTIRLEDVVPLVWGKRPVNESHDVAVPRQPGDSPPSRIGTAHAVRKHGEWLWANVELWGEAARHHVGAWVLPSLRQHVNGAWRIVDFAPTCLPVDSEASRWGVGEALPWEDDDAERAGFGELLARAVRL